MTYRITQKDLQSQIDWLNEMNKSQNYRDNGHYTLSMAYGGYRLDQRTGAGFSVISPNGHGTKRELDIFLSGYKHKFYTAG